MCVGTVSVRRPRDCSATSSLTYSVRIPSTYNEFVSEVWSPIGAVTDLPIGGDSGAKTTPNDDTTYRYVPIS